MGTTSKEKKNSSWLENKTQLHSIGKKVHWEDLEGVGGEGGGRGDRDGEHM